jgi:hypothetical protein
MTRKRLPLISRLRYAQYFFWARGALIRGDYGKANVLTNKIFRLFGVAGPNAKVPPLLNVLLGLAAWNLKNFDQTYQSCRIAVNQIEYDLTQSISVSKLNELKYLRHYCATLVKYSDAEGGVRDQYDFQDLERVRFPDYDLRMVSSSLKDTFPIELEN